MRRTFPAVLVCCVLLGCGGNDEDGGAPTPTPAPATATPTESAPEVTPSPTIRAPTPTPTPTPEPVEAADCGRSLLSEDDPSRARLMDLEGKLVFSCGGQVWTANPDGSGQTRLTADVDIDWEDVRLNLSPGGFPPSRQERADLEAQMNTSPRWLADGRIAFVSIRDTLKLSADSPEDRKRFFSNATEVYVIDADGTGEHRVTDYNLTPGSYVRPNSGEFSPAMECMGPNFCVAGMLTVRPFAGAHTQTVLAVEIVEIRFSECCFLFGTLDLSAPAPVLEFGGIEGARLVGQDWSLDDQAVLSTLQFWDGLMAVDTELRLEPGGPVVSVEGYTTGASFSPDGRSIAYCGFASRPGPWQVRAVDASTGVARVLLAVEDTLVTRDCRPRWSPDGSHIVVHDSNGRILVVDAETGQATPVANGVSPDWGSQAMGESRRRTRCLRTPEYGAYVRTDNRTTCPVAAER